MSKDNDIFSKIKLLLNDTEQLKKIFPAINSAGYPFIALFFFIALLLSLFSDFLGWIGFLLSLWCVYFFRDPERVTPDIKNTVISPADGKIVKVVSAKSPENLQDKRSLQMTKISVFMNVFNVHVNRAPVAGNIKDIIYVPGKFINASLDKASEHNERNILVLENNKNEEIIVVQIAGLIARRILSFVNLFDSLKIGERFGLIRFGSRVDVYLPSNYAPKVELGQKVIAGETIIAS